MLGEQEFQKQCDEAVGSLYRKLAEASDRFDFDVDMNSGALTVEFEEPRERFVVSPNTPVRQIWVSAHTTSFKLDWVPDRQAFILASTGESLEELIITAIQKRIPEFTLG
jgi:CyaY protein